MKIAIFNISNLYFIFLTDFKKEGASQFDQYVQYF